MHGGEDELTLVPEESSPRNQLAPVNPSCNPGSSRDSRQAFLSLDLVILANRVWVFAKYIHFMKPCTWSIYEHLLLFSPMMRNNLCRHDWRSDQTPERVVMNGISASQSRHRTSKSGLLILFLWVTVRIREIDLMSKTDFISILSVDHWSSCRWWSKLWRQVSNKPRRWQRETKPASIKVKYMSYLTRLRHTHQQCVFAVPV